MSNIPVQYFSAAILITNIAQFIAMIYFNRKTNK